MSDQKGWGRQKDSCVRKEQEPKGNKEQEEEKELSSSSIFCQDAEELPIDFGVTESFEA